MHAARLATLALGARADPCCTTCTAPLVKYYSVDVSGGFCGEACLNPSKYSLYHLFEKNLTLVEEGSDHGPCAEQFAPDGSFYQVYSDTVTHGVPGLLAVTLDLYAPTGSSLKVGDSCSLYAISDDTTTCGESVLDCKYTSMAKLAEPSLEDGTCASQGYTHATGSQTKTYPVIGEIVITTYDKATLQVLQVGDSCSLYAISDDAATCGESVLDCKYTSMAKLAEPSLKDGTCAAQGYTHATGSQTKTYPVIGNIEITTYDKATFFAV